MSSKQKNNLFERALQCLSCTDLDLKLELSAGCYADLLAGRLAIVDTGNVEAIDEPGRPDKPSLVSGRAVPTRSLGSEKGRAAFIHALAHIEFNAINLGWDAVYRFRGMPDQYYIDWSRVAAEEASHFKLLRDQLIAGGYDYGDFDAHNGLWEMAQKTAGDPLERMALVPRVLEARGLDVAPGMIKKFDDMEDVIMSSVMQTILDDEVGHVEIGSRWFVFLCEQRGLQPDPTYKKLFDHYMGKNFKGPLNQDARLKAGFSENEIEYLNGLI